jgi:hypothetical protein
MAMMRHSLLGAMVAVGLMAASPAIAGPDEAAFLESYFGAWTGSGTLTGGEEPATFECRLLTRRGNAGKLVFSGNCPLLSGAGAVAFAESDGLYVMAMTTNADYGGNAIGRWEGDDLVFLVDDSNAGEEGNALDLGAELAMRGDTITVSFTATVDGAPWKGEVVFRR